MEITEKDVAHLAELARLGLTSAEKKAYAGELNGIVGWLDVLNEADTSAALPLVNSNNSETMTAADTPEIFPAGRALLELAPAVEAGFIKTRKVLP